MIQSQNQNPTVAAAGIRFLEQHFMANSDIPHDILLLILIRLPVKSFLRFRCVSKSWNLLISTQDFAKLHLNHSLIHPKPQWLLWNNELKEGRRRLHIYAVDCSKLEKLANMDDLYHPVEVPGLMESILIGSCNGLLCATWVCYNGSGYEDSFFVFNPLTRKGSNIRCPLTPRSYYYGFGYDDAHDDYKVVRWNVLPYFAAATHSSVFDVYSVRDGSWSAIYSMLNWSSMMGISCGVLVNCVLHWIRGSGNGRDEIVAFDLRTNEEKLMETSENDLGITKVDNNDEYRWGMELGVLNGCLCGIVFYGNTSNKLDLWIMKEYGLNDSWTKMTIDLPLRHLFEWVVHTKLGKMTPTVPIVYVANKRQMILYSYVQGFLLCDIINNQLSKVIKIPEFFPKEYLKVPERFSFVSKEFRFEGSLVQPPGFVSFSQSNKKKEKKE